MVLADKAFAISSRYSFFSFSREIQEYFASLNKRFLSLCFHLKEEFEHVFRVSFFFFFLKSNLTENNILTKRRISILDQDVAKLAFYVRRILYIFLL